MNEKEDGKLLLMALSEIWSTLSCIDLGLMTDGFLEELSPLSIPR